MKIVFLAGPFRGDGSKESKLSNVETARQWVNKFIEAEIPYYSPHLNVSQETLNYGSTKDEFATNVHNLILGQAEILAVLPDYQESSGTLAEIANAESKGMPVVYLDKPDAIEQLKELLK